jgi:glycosyltransferase involved in cell wall biosynthesis
LKQKYNIETNKKIILFVGRLDPIKGTDILINSFRKVLKQKPECRLIIAGEGDFGKYFEAGEYIWTKITFTGRLDKSKLFELYRIADIGVMPSTHEQCSYTAIEMMMHGLPVIVSTTTGLNEMVENDISGLKVPVMELEDKVEISDDLLFEQILCLLNNPEKLNKIKGQSRKRYLKYYSGKVMKQNMIDFYNKIFF